MNYIKRLILKEWFRYFSLSVIVLLIIITISNLISGLLRGNVSSEDVFFNYLLELPGHFSKILPVSCLVGSLFSINKLKSSNELTAVFSLGLSRKVFMVYLIQASLIVAGIQFINSSFLQPSVMQKKNRLIANSENKFRNLKSQGLRSSTIGSGKIWFKSPEYFFSFSSYNRHENIINALTIFYFDKESKVSRVINSKKAGYVADNRWQLLSGSVLNKLNNETFPEYEKFDSLIVNLNETPKDFKTIESDITTLTLFKLYRYIRGLDLAGISTDEYKVIFLDKFSSSLICIIFSLLAAIGIFNPNRRSSSFGKNVSLIFLFTLSYWLIHSFFFEQGKSTNLNPYIASFTVPFLFSMILVGFFVKHRRLA